MRLLNSLIILLVSLLVRVDGGAMITDIKNAEAADKFTESHLTAIIGFFDDRESEEAKNFIKIAMAIRDCGFGITNNTNVFTKYAAKSGTVILFNKYDSSKVEFEGELSVTALKEFIAEKSMPLIIDYNLSHRIFEGSIMKRVLIFLVSKKAGHIEKYAHPAKDLAKKFKNEVLFITVDVDDVNHNMILHFFNIKPEHVPVLRLVHFDDSAANTYVKYKPQNPELTLDNIKSFVEDFLAGKLTRYLISQDLPEDWDKTPIKTLVTSNFDEVVFDKEKSVVVEFYGTNDWGKYESIFDKLGEKYKDSPTIVLAKVDAFANELEHTQLFSVPTLKFYRKGDNAVFDYEGVRTFEAIVRFIEKNEHPKEEL